MDAFAKMDIFFIVTTVAVVVIAVFVAVILFYVLRTARDVNEVVHIVRKESERFAKGASSARHRIKEGGDSILQNVVAFVQSFAEKKKRWKRKED
ncbi:MAG: hypothetical protein A2747_02500 [Candidatus Yonathbacteria bacterium RIFCSPHIGHO2_01_FULL_44_41]|uniref:Uncharacterized protein n=1 Tax=Candidatus Yonathbacteria bacterium RIFCSPHIGHO2_02_FULL_44_14 TaxID=1802724 RepID=A0A1G2S6D5_9BACT|nr:MAG: hypothetical protein A2747_02500 [Candidatus Yonathbacteria bacterium RIFCSPHIGHO2_01_FULL_44_41]OHA80616.1 MAG: hypothetical protein A3D51_00890 [Candidatus Yonathbacteria bacterium RIFCSPHIGHO2_02_FULL_44_14]OHA82092.1 MAG: hypothetical protein A3B06_01105 [Candidatus Yonathbacteria bacterium RIFCSPLOWO2_01_FULL_43_20]